jgi:tRNA threonylcarbamoyladenosine biosynthesis protein TsaE
VRAICYSGSEVETRAVGKALVGSLSPDGVLLLFGDLGSGKTVLTQGLAMGLGVEPSEVLSPTFTLIREHRGSAGDLVHIDLYRLEGRDLESVGLWEVLAGPGVKAVEWSERLTFEIPDAIRVRLRVLETPDRREIEITSRDENHRLEQALRFLSARQG